MAMRLPRIARIARVLQEARSVSPNMIEPSMPARLFGSSRRIDRPVMVLPQPLSPTMPTRSPGATSKSILRVACQTPCAVLKRMPRPRTEISGWDALRAPVRACPVACVHQRAARIFSSASARATGRRGRAADLDNAQCDSGIPILPTRPERGADRVVRGFFCRQRIARKCGPGKRKFHSVCQNEIGKERSRLSQPNAMASAPHCRLRSCSGLALRSERSGTRNGAALGWRAVRKARTGWKRSPA